MFLKLHSFKKLCNFSILKNWLEIDKCTCLCRCTCWPRQPSQLSGCHRGRHGSVYRILGQLPQDLELKKWKQHLKIHLTKSKLSSWQQNHNQSFWKLLKIKRLNDNNKENGFQFFFLKFYFWPSWVSLFQCSRSVIRWVLLSFKKKSEKIRLAFIVFFYLCCSSLQVLHKLNLHGKKGQLLHLTKKNETFKNRKVKQLFSSTLGFILQKNLSMTLQEIFFKIFFRCN